MKRTLSTLLLLLTLIIFLPSCQKSWEDYYNPGGVTEHTYWGPIVKMGDGSARSYFTLSKTGVPLKIGIEMKDAALDNLPTDEKDFTGSTFMLAIPAQAKKFTAFDHIVVNWNVHGHEPEHVYDKPHFDFHFYKMSVDAQLAIPPYMAETAAAFDNLPPDGYLPATFVPTPGGVPQMGKHWADTQSDEAMGLPFTKTFIYGTYNGAVTFLEPMITHDLLKSGVESSTAFAQPNYVSPDKTYYPTKYGIETDEARHMHYVLLSDFQWR